MTVLVALAALGAGVVAPADGAAGAQMALVRRRAHRVTTPRSVRPVQLPVISQLLDGSGLGDLLQGLLQPLAPAPVVPTVDPAVVSRVVASTVRVSGPACGYTVSGSGFSAAPDTIVTNAHVVAGMTRPQVLRPDGRSLNATVVVFDPNRDLAVLSVPGLGEPALAVGSATVGGPGAIFGHPQGQAPVDVSPAQVTREVSAQVDNIYGQPVTRQILVLAARVEPGDSGAALVDQTGSVVGVTFAVSTARPLTAFAVDSQELAPVLSEPRGSAVRTGPCIS
ncbi:MAG: trypsin-like peptidase domain-containing protein [Acidimicrobiales bacterium]